MAAFDPDALDAYVRHGFRQDGDRVRLKCDPDTEADTFDNGGNHTTWDRLGGLSTSRSSSSPVAVEEHAAVGGRRRSSPSELPHGRFVLGRRMDHFGPMTHPAEIAALVAADRADHRVRP